MNETQELRRTISQKYSDFMPKGAGVLFFIQIFSILAFSVLYSTLVLYATNSLQLNDATATGITVSFVAFNYALHLVGGYIGGRYISYRALFCIGMIAIAFGCILVSIPTTNSLYWGLATFLTGAGLNITCLNCMLTQLFQPNDKRREAAFLWNYSGMNLGFFLGFTISGYFQLTHAYHELFLLSSISSFIALGLILLKWKSLPDINTQFIQLIESEKRLANFKGFALLVILCLSLRWILENASFTNNLIMILGIFMAFVIGSIAIKEKNPNQSKKIWGFFILSLMALVFWTLYQLAPMGLTLFIERNVDRHYFGIIIAPQWVQTVNTIVIIIGGPLLSMMFNSLRTKNINFTLPMQFAFALFLIGASFAVLSLGIHFADDQGYTNFNWIIGSSVLLSLGELFISPIGYAMVGQLAPAHLQGLMMGTWMMLSGIAATLSGYFSTMALGTSQSVDPLITNTSFHYTFSLLGWFAITAGAVLIIILPLVLRLTQEKKTSLKQTAMSGINA
jgi:POT family proton-dependent oligopeptide transporter